MCLAVALKSFVAVLRGRALSRELDEFQLPDLWRILVVNRFGLEFLTPTKEHRYLN